jgi:uncharacterized membrane protein
MMKKIFTRLQNPKVIVSVVSGILLILVNIGAIDVSMSDKAMEITNIILGIGISVGIFGNPDSHIQDNE